MNWPVFIIFSVIIAGFAAFMIGHTLAANWRPLWQVALYTLLLGAANRFMAYALFGGELLSITAYGRDTAVLLLIAIMSYRLTTARKMATQYPWKIKRRGLFRWQEVPPDERQDKQQDD